MLTKGLAEVKKCKKSELILEVGGWVQVSLEKKCKSVPKQSYTSSDILGLYVMCIFYVYTLLKAISHYDLSVLSMSVMSLQKESLDRGVSGWCELYPVVFLGFVLLRKPLSCCKKR